MKRLLTILGFLAALLAGCTDQQWDEFCPDGHCPLAKLGKAANEAERQKALQGGRIVPVAPVRPVPKVPPCK